jgi:hypothetical protein
MSDNQAPTEAIYRDLVGTIRGNTGGPDHPQPPAASEPAVLGTVTGTIGHETDRVKAVLQRAKNQNVLLSTPGGRLVLNTEDALRDFAAVHGQEGDRDRVAWANRRLDALENGDGEPTTDVPDDRGIRVVIEG